MPRTLLAATGALIVGAALAMPAAASAATRTAHSGLTTSAQATRHAAARRPATTIAPAAKTSVKLSVTSGLPGATVKFTGGGFKARESVTLHWHSRGGPKLTKVTATRSGVISGKFSVPLPRAGVPAKTSVYAIGAKSHRSAKASFTQSCTDEWTSTKGGSWAKTSDWSTGSVPGAATAACITLAGSKSYQVTARASAGQATVGSLRLGATSGKTTQTLEIDAGGGSDLSLQLADPSVIEARGALVLTSAGNGNPWLQGSSLANYGKLSTIAGKGWSRYLNTNITNEPGGTFSVAAADLPGGATYQQGGTTVVNKGTMTIAKGAAYAVGQATFTQDGGSITNSGTFQVSNATVIKSGGSAKGTAWSFINGAILKDSASGGSGSFSFDSDGTLSGGIIPRGQTITVDGNGSDTHLTLARNTTNDGTLVMTSSHFNNNGGSNAWLVPASGTVTLTNKGTLDTKLGIGWSRYFNVDVTNAAGGTMNLGAQDTYVDGGFTLTNNGTLNVADTSVLILSGTSDGNADFVQGGSGTLGISANWSKGETSLINQYQCSAGGCQTEGIDLAGTLHITSTGTPSGTWAPIYSQFSAIDGTFARVTGSSSYVVTYNQPDEDLANEVGDVLVDAK